MCLEIWDYSLQSLKNPLEIEMLFRSSQATELHCTWSYANQFDAHNCERTKLFAQRNLRISYTHKHMKQLHSTHALVNIYFRAVCESGSGARCMRAFMYVSFLLIYFLDAKHCSSKVSVFGVPAWYAVLFVGRYAPTLCNLIQCSTLCI